MGPSPVELGIVTVKRRFRRQGSTVADGYISESLSEGPGIALLWHVRLFSAFRPARPLRLVSTSPRLGLPRPTVFRQFGRFALRLLVSFFALRLLVSFGGLAPVRVSRRVVRGQVVQAFSELVEQIGWFSSPAVAQSLVDAG